MTRKELGGEIKGFILALLFPLLAAEWFFNIFRHDGPKAAGFVAFGVVGLATSVCLAWSVVASFGLCEWSGCDWPIWAVIHIGLAVTHVYYIGRCIRAGYR